MRFLATNDDGILAQGLECLVAARQCVHGLLYRYGAQFAQPSPGLDPQVVGFRRELVNEEKPSPRAGLPLRFGFC